MTQTVQERQKKLRREAFAQVLHAVALGANNNQAAKYAGRNPTVLSAWLYRGKEALAPDGANTVCGQDYAEFVTEFECIRARVPKDKIRFAAELVKEQAAVECSCILCS